MRDRRDFGKKNLSTLGTHALHFHVIFLSVQTLCRVFDIRAFSIYFVVLMNGYSILPIILSIIIFSKNLAGSSFVISCSIVSLKEIS